MSKTLRLLLLMAGTFVFAVLALVLEANSQDQPKMAGMKHSSLSVADKSAKVDPQEMDQAMRNMSTKHMDMSPHMKMTELRPMKRGDQERADKIAHVLRVSINKYKDYKNALDDGYKIFLPNVKSPIKHFTNWQYALEATYRFNPEHPTSLLYEQHGNGYKLIGAMYTAPRRFTEHELDERVPLSVAQWHEHVNMCKPPKGQEGEMFSANPRFGLAGSISTEGECEAAGGQFQPVVFNWMVHAYPFEKNTQDIWSVERQMAGHHHGE